MSPGDFNSAESGASNELPPYRPTKRVGKYHSRRLHTLKHHFRLSPGCNPSSAKCPPQLACPYTRTPSCFDLDSFLFEQIGNEEPQELFTESLSSNTYTRPHSCSEPGAQARALRQAAGAAGPALAPSVGAPWEGGVIIPASTSYLLVPGLSSSFQCNMQFLCLNGHFCQENWLLTNRGEIMERYVTAPKPLRHKGISTTRNSKAGIPSLASSGDLSRGKKCCSGPGG